MRILAVCPIKFDGTSYYRAYGIFPDLKKQFADDGETFEVHPFYDSGNYSWADLMPYDILFLQRPAQNASKHIKMIQFMKNMGKKVWVDFDDNLFQVPMENRVFEDMTKEVLESMLQVILLADLITVSTPPLKELYLKLNVTCPIEVVPNAWNFQTHPFTTEYNQVKQLPPPQKTKVKYLWRGSETHQGDLWSSAESIFSAIAEKPDTMSYTFMGYNPWMITENMPREWWSFRKSEDIWEYFRILKSEAPQVIFFPLRYNDFNKCKSNIAWMEATYAGAACIAPDRDCWQMPGVIGYDNESELKQLLMDYNEDHYRSFWKESSDYIRENLSLTKINAQRKQLLKSLLS